MDNLLSYNYYPIFKTVFNHLDLETLLSCYEVSKDFRQMVVNISRKVQYSEEAWLRLFKIEKEGDHIHNITNFEQDKYPKGFIDAFKEQIIKFDWLVYLVDYTTLTEEFLEQNIKHVNLVKASIYCKLSESFIKKYSDKVDWEMICKYQNLSVDFIKEHKDSVAWKILIEYNKIPTKYFQSMMDQYKEEIEKDDHYWYLQYEIAEAIPSDVYYSWDIDTLF